MLNSSAHHILANNCQSGPPATPNNTFGNGRLDILAAVNQAPAFQLSGAASVKTHGAQSFGIPLPISGEPGVECRSSKQETLVFTFTDNVVSGNASLTSGSGRVAGTSFSGNTMTVNLTRVADVQKITVMLSGVTNGSSQVAPDASVSMNVLSGDVNADKTVDATDVNVTRGQTGMPVTSANFREDVKPDGAINNRDVKTVRRSLGHTLP